MCRNYSRRICILLVLVFSFISYAQDSSASSQKHQWRTRPLTLSGPRFGFTLITGDMADTLRHEFDAVPFITQFGWQWERRFMATDDGMAGLTELIVLAGGMEQGLFLPSASFIVGLRTAGGTEFGLGPNVSVGGVAYVFAVGTTKSHGNLNFPINLSVVTSKSGLRIGLLFGFNMRS